MKAVYDKYDSPIGQLHIVVDKTGLKNIIILPEQWEKYIITSAGLTHDPKVCLSFIKELDEYFCGKRKEFTIPLSVEGTAFYRQVWSELLSIPFGETRTYSEIAHAVGSPKACRAVGQANRNNPIPIVIPCHRVVGKSGELTGYLGNKPDIKKKLLHMERDLL